MSPSARPRTPKRNSERIQNIKLTAQSPAHERAHTKPHFLMPSSSSSHRKANASSPLAPDVRMWAPEYPRKCSHAQPHRLQFQSLPGHARRTDVADSSSTPTVGPILVRSGLNLADSEKMWADALRGRQEFGPSCAKFRTTQATYGPTSPDVDPMMENIDMHPRNLRNHGSGTTTWTSLLRATTLSRAIHPLCITRLQLSNTQSWRSKAKAWRTEKKAASAMLDRTVERLLHLHAVLESCFSDTSCNMELPTHFHPFPTSRAHSQRPPLNRSGQLRCAAPNWPSLSPP